MEGGPAGRTGGEARGRSTMSTPREEAPGEHHPEVRDCLHIAFFHPVFVRRTFDLLTSYVNSTINALNPFLNWLKKPLRVNTP